MKKLLSIAGMALLFSGAGSKKAAVVIPKKLDPYVKPDYADSYTQLSGLEKSALHWNYGITIFCIKCEPAYVQNYLEYQKQFEADDEDEDEEVTYNFIKYAEKTVFVKNHYILKQNHYLNEKAIPEPPDMVAVMIKREAGYDPEFGDWQYGYFNAKGNVIVEGKGSKPAIRSLCSDCHKNISERDHIFSRHLVPNFCKKNDCKKVGK